MAKRKIIEAAQVEAPGVDAATDMALERERAANELYAAHADANGGLLPDEQMVELGSVIDAEAGDVGYGMIDTEFCKPLLDAGFVVVNMSIAENGLTAAKSTQAGVDYWQTHKTTVDTVAPVVQVAANATVKQKAAPMTFEIHSDFVPPAGAKRRVGRNDSYPFDKLAVGQSFFVPATEAKPEPHKSMLSTVTQAMGRYAEGTGKMKTTAKGNTVEIKNRTRVFGLYEHTKDGVKGAMILRHEDAAAGTASE